MDFDELQLSRATECAMRGLDQRGFAHAARAPEQSVVGGQSLREAPRVGEQEIARAVDPSSRPSSTRLIFATGAKLVVAARQTKASALEKSGVVGVVGASRSKASAMRSSRAAAS